MTSVYSIDLVNYHIRLLADKDFIETLNTSTLNEEGYIVIRLKSAGHDYLDAIKDANIWNKTKSRLGSLMSSAAFDIIKATALGILKETLEI